MPHLSGCLTVTFYYRWSHYGTEKLGNESRTSLSLCTLIHVTAGSSNLTVTLPLSDGSANAVLAKG